MTRKFNIEAARNAGYSDKKIQDYLKANPDIKPTQPVKNESSGIQVPKSVKKVAELIQTPARGLRGVGVLAQKALEKVDPTVFLPGGTPAPEEVSKIAQNIVGRPGEQGAVERAAEAVKPGFVPQEGERLGATTGEVAGSLPLATLGTGVGPAAGLASKAKLGYQIIRSAITGGGMTFLDQAAEEGKIKPGQIASSAAIGSSLPLIKPATELIRKGARRILPKVSEFLTGTPEAALIRQIDEPKSLLNIKGTEEMIEKRVIDTQNAIKSARTNVGNLRNKELKRLGIVFEETEEDLLNKIASGEPPTVDLKDISAALKGVKNTPNLPWKTKIKTLLDAKKNLKAHINHVNLNQQVRPVSDEFQRDLTRFNRIINNELDKIPQAKRLRAIDRAYSEVNALYDNLQKKISEVGKAEDFLESLFIGKKVGKMKGTIKQHLKDLATVERFAGKKVVEPLEREFTVQALKQILPKRGLGLFAGLAAGGGAALAGSPITTAGMVGMLSPKATSLGISAAQKAASILTDPKTRALVQALQQQRNRNR